MNNYLTERDRETIGEIINLASKIPSSEDLTTLSTQQAICLGYIQGISTKVMTHEKE